MEKDFEKQFDKCPNCGCKERFLEELGKELHERGLASEDWQMHYDVRRGIVLDKAKESSIPIGAEIPGFVVVTDICIDCGCIYAKAIVRTDVKKSIAPAPPMMPPNRAQRRREDRSGPLSLN